MESLIFNGILFGVKESLIFYFHFAVKENSNFASLVGIPNS